MTKTIRTTIACGIGRHDLCLSVGTVIGTDEPFVCGCYCHAKDAGS